MNAFVDKLYALLMNPQKSIDYVGLECYLKTNLGVDESSESLEYLEIPHIMEKIRKYLREGGQALFDNILKHMQ